MAFRKFGGLEYNKSNNYVSSNTTNNTNLIITDTLGKLNTKFTLDSHMDLNNQSMFNVGDIYFSNGKSIVNGDVTNQNTFTDTIIALNGIDASNTSTFSNATITSLKCGNISNDSGNITLESYGTITLNTPNISDMPSIPAPGVYCHNLTSYYSIKVGSDSSVGDTILQLTNISGVDCNLSLSTYGILNFSSGINIPSGKSYSIDNINILESPAFTGNPTAPTPQANNISNSIATTNYVTSAISTNNGNAVYTDQANNFQNLYTQTFEGTVNLYSDSGYSPTLELSSGSLSTKMYQVNDIFSFINNGSYANNAGYIFYCNNNASTPSAQQVLNITSNATNLYSDLEMNNMCVLGINTLGGNGTSAINFSTPISMNTSQPININNSTLNLYSGTVSSELGQSSGTLTISNNTLYTNSGTIKLNLNDSNNNTFTYFQLTPLGTDIYTPLNMNNNNITGIECIYGTPNTSGNYDVVQTTTPLNNSITTAIATTGYVQTAISNIPEVTSPYFVGQLISGMFPTNSSTLLNAGFLYCDGSSLSTTTYSALFALIGYSYGGSDGTFSLPSFKGNMPLGGNGDTTSNNPVPSYGGSIIGGNSTISDVPSHTHTISDNGHVHSVNDPGHQHTANINWSKTNNSSPNENLLFDSQSNANQAFTTNTAYTGIVVNSAYTGITIDFTGTTSVPVLNPYCAVNYFIYSGVN
uniref:Phage tail collar domain-containing protein n=1 Tax=viral metagenome TaxID=1070528 RepID=A0A6C0HS71_9ZZZZ